MGIPIPGKDGLYIETGPISLLKAVHMPFIPHHGRYGRREVLSMFKGGEQMSPRRSITTRPNEAGERLTHHFARRKDAQWSTIGYPIKSLYCCKYCVPNWLMLLPPLYHRCAPLRPTNNFHWTACGATIAFFGSLRKAQVSCCSSYT